MPSGVYSGNLVNLIGKKFGRLIVIRKVSKDKWGNITWLCKCECEREKVISGHNLRNGSTKSCGCLHNELTSNRFKLDLGISNMQRLMRNYKSHAKRRGYSYELTKEQFIKLTKQDCYYCGAPPNNIAKSKNLIGEYIYNGIDRVDNTKGYTIDNVVPCCKHCNRAKDTMTLKEFKNWLKRTYIKLIK